MRKKIITSTLAIAVIIAVISVSQSCTKVANKLHFNLKMKTGSVNITIPATVNMIGSNSFGPVTNTYNVDSFIKAQTGTLLGIDNITSVKIASVVIVDNDPTPANNFQNFQSGYLEFYSDKFTVPYQVNIANIKDTFTTSINVPVDTSAELKSYIGTQFNYTVHGTLRRATTADMHCTIQYAFNIVIEG